MGEFQEIAQSIAAALQGIVKERSQAHGNANSGQIDKDDLPSIIRDAIGSRRDINCSTRTKHVPRQKTGEEPNGQSPVNTDKIRNEIWWKWREANPASSPFSGKYQRLKCLGQLIPVVRLNALAGSLPVVR